MIFLSQARTWNSKVIIMSWVFFVLKALKWEIVDRFVDIGGIVDNHCLNFLFIITEKGQNKQTMVYKTKQWRKDGVTGITLKLIVNSGVPEWLIIFDIVIYVTKASAILHRSTYVLFYILLVRWTFNVFFKLPLLLVLKYSNIYKKKNKKKNNNFERIQFCLMKYNYKSRVVWEYI